jgi:hypothetical protein
MTKTDKVILTGCLQVIAHRLIRVSKNLDSTDLSEVIEIVDLADSFISSTKEHLQDMAAKE